jgi:broad specificity phosphatase PhoE
VKTFLLTLFIACCFSTSVVADDTSSHYKLYLIRHAEKQPDGSRDPVLTEAGKQRSEQLAKWFQDKDIKDIWSSDYHRTRDTVKPLLKQLGLALNNYDPGNQSVLVKQLLDRQRNALVVGHSNTIPELARLLCKCKIADMDDSEHDRLIVVAVIDGATMVGTLQQNVLFQR